jgi:K+-sensing histidine kinase KdpD
MALRELALRRTADRVEDDVQAYRVTESIKPVWKTEAAVLCCIGPREDAEHVVRSAARLAQQLAVAWHAVYVETPALREARQCAARTHSADGQAGRGSGCDDRRAVGPGRSPRRWWSMRAITTCRSC